MRQKFKEHFGSLPRGLALNSETYYDAVTPAITDQYGYHCYKVAGNFTYQAPTVSTDDQRVVAVAWAENNTDDAQTMSVSLSGSKAKSTTLTWQRAVGLTISAKVTVKEVFEFGGEISVTETVGEESSTSDEIGVSTTASVNVPPRSKRKVTLVGTHHQESVSFEVHISVSGYFGANFDPRVNGHYYWFLRADLVLPRSSGTIRGTLTHADVYEIHTRFDEAVSID